MIRRFVFFNMFLLFSLVVAIPEAVAQSRSINVCTSVAAIQNWLFNPDLVGRAKLNGTINEVYNFLPKLEKLCYQSPTPDTVHYGGAMEWLKEADTLGAYFSEIVFNAFTREKPKDFSQHKLNELLALESYRLQLRLNEIRSVVYDSVTRGVDSGHCESDDQQCLSITVNPWAIVCWEGKEAEVSDINPLVISGLTPGNYVFTFDHPIFEPLKLNITIMEEKQSIHVDLFKDASTKNKLGDK